MRSYTKRQTVYRQTDKESKPVKAAQTFFCLDADTKQPVCFTTATAALSASAAIKLLCLAEDILQPQPYQTIAVVAMYLIVALSVSFLLSLTENQRPIELVFETVSALATVGLSTGVTPELSGTGRLLIIMTMFLGRIGPFTLALAIGERQQQSERYRYPEERVQIG